MRHFCASELYLGGLDLIAIQEVLGHSWIATTMRYVHVQQTRVEDALVAGQQRAAKRSTTRPPTRPAGPATTGSALPCEGRTPPWSGFALTGSSKRP
ncbi:tyrosine-type recombinase/integrase [Streptomyces erythrochromogenes]|uniref:tyrosine-type recombinase/integrase n=1 Tax=Streptomyces erythrochromogenes TaxID=285574 RepID=UPI0038307E1C